MLLSVYQTSVSSFSEKKTEPVGRTPVERISSRIGVVENSQTSEGESDGQRGKWDEKVSTVAHEAYILTIPLFQVSKVLLGVHSALNCTICARAFEIMTRHLSQNRNCGWLKQTLLPTCIIQVPYVRGNV